jgi:hypothetical protein
MGPRGYRPEFRRKVRQTLLGAGAGCNRQDHEGAQPRPPVVVGGGEQHADLGGGEGRRRAQGEGAKVGAQVMFEQLAVAADGSQPEGFVGLQVAEPITTTGVQSQVLVQPRPQRHRLGTDLGAGRAQRVGGLLGVAGLDPCGHTIGNGRSGSQSGSLAAGSVAGPRRAGPLTAPPAARHRNKDSTLATRPPRPGREVGAPVRAGPVARAGLAASTRGVGHRVAFGERRGLALAARRNPSISTRSRWLACWTRSPSAD